MSSWEHIFQKSAVYYEKSLKNSGYKTKLQYKQPKENNQNKKKRKFNIIWFNPSYCKSVKTNIGRISIKLISKHFPPNHKFVKIFNKNIVKLNYSCMPNIRSKINGHNKKILASKPTELQKLCNCLIRELKRKPIRIITSYCRKNFTVLLVWNFSYNKMLLFWLVFVLFY